MELKNYTVNVRLPASRPGVKGVVQKVKIKAENQSRATALAKMQYGEVLGTAVTDFEADRAEAQASRPSQVSRQTEKSESRGQQNSFNQEDAALGRFLNTKPAPGSGPVSTVLWWGIKSVFKVMEG